MSRRRFHGLSAKVRVTLAATLVVGVVTAGGALLVNGTVTRALRGRMEAEVRAAVHEVAGDLKSGVAPETVYLDTSASGTLYPPVVEIIGEGLDLMVLRSKPVQVTPTFVKRVAGPPVREAPMYLDERIGDPAWIVTTKNVEVGGKTLLLVGAAPKAAVSGRSDPLVLSLLIGVPVLVLGVGVVVWVTVGRALRPVERLRSEAEQISYTTLDRRLPVPASMDEVGRLARTMNHMLDRLHDASTKQREFVADASHELRSPVAAIGATVEVGLAHPEQTDWQNLVRNIGIETDQLAGLVDDLLALAVLDERVPELDEDVDLDDLAIEQADRLSETTVRTGGIAAARVRGNRGQLERLVRNLLDNAARHGGGTVAVSTALQGGTAEILVDDDGPGVPAAERERVFERFSRVDASRGREGGGFGLGLAMVSRIAALHGGSATVEDSPLGGARFRVRIPVGEDLARG